MATTQQISDYAQTAQAAYATGLIGGANNTGTLVQDADMSASQATQFDAQWNVLSQSARSDGFSAVLLQRRTTDGSQGEKVLAIAGTDSTRRADSLSVRRMVFCGQ